MESRDHLQLKQVAMRWLRHTGCVAFAMEVDLYPMGIVDVAGLKPDGDLYIIEAKISNSDMQSDVRPRKGFMGYSKINKIQVSKKVSFVYYIVADAVDTSALPTEFGILDQTGTIVRRSKRHNGKPDAKEKARRFDKLARALSWRAYGHVIRHEKEQLQFSL